MTLRARVKVWTRGRPPGLGLFRGEMTIRPGAMLIASTGIMLTAIRFMLMHP